MIKLNQNQYQRFKGWGNSLSDRHIYAFFPNEKEKALNYYMQVLGFKDSLITDVLSKFPEKIFDDSLGFEWQLMTSTRRNIPLVEARNTDGTKITSTTTGMIGVGTKPFYLVFGVSYFAKGDTIVGHYNEKYPLRIIEEPKNEGSNVVCKVELMAGITTGMPVNRLLPGERFSYEYNVVASGLSRRVGDLNFSAPIKMSGEFSTYRLQHKASGEMFDDKIAIGIPVIKDGKVSVENSWIHYVQYEFDKKFKEQEATLFQYGRSNRTATGEYFNHDDSGQVIRMGAGMNEQIESGNVEYYNDKTEIIPRLTAALEDISYGKIPMKARNFVVSLGSKAYQAISEYATTPGSGWRDLGKEGNPPYVTKAPGNDVPNGVRINNYQVNEWVTSTGIHLIFKISDVLDDPVRNKLYHHDGGLLSSYEIRICHLGDDMTEPNIQIARPRNDMSKQPVSLQWGLRNPFTGEMNNPNMSYDEDSASIHKMGSIGAIVYDPLRCYSLLPNYTSAM